MSSKGNKREAKTMIRPPSGSSAAHAAKLLLLVEGINDIDFLKRISAVLHADDQSLPDLAKLDQRDSLIVS